MVGYHHCCCHHHDLFPCPADVGGHLSILVLGHQLGHIFLKPNPLVVTMKLMTKHVDVIFSVFMILCFYDLLDTAYPCSWVKTPQPLCVVVPWSWYFMDIIFVCNSWIFFLLTHLLILWARASLTEGN